MRKVIVFALSITLIVLVLSSCMFTSVDVTFIYGDGREPLELSVTENAELYIPDPKSDDLIFAGWYADEQLTKPILDYSSLGTEKRLYAKWVEKGSFAVTFVYGLDIPNSTVIFEESIVHPADPKRAGYSFLGWFTDEECSLSYDFDAPITEQYLVLYAGWKEEPTPSVSFIKDGDVWQEFTVKWGETLDNIPVPDKEGFSGWYYDEDCNFPFDNKRPIEGDVVLYADFDTSITDFANSAAEELLLSCVKVVAVSEKLGMTTASQGSGVIYASSSGYYYCLTNEHVVETNSIFNTGYYVYDCYGNKYLAHLLARSAACDLAVLCFSSDEELKVAEFASANPKNGDKIVSVSSPGGVFNYTSYGEVKEYSDFAEDDLDIIVGFHTAPIDHGSSGGGVFDRNMKMIGINFASALDSNEEFVYGMFVPIDTVIEFLISNNLYL